MQPKTNEDLDLPSLGQATLTVKASSQQQAGSVLVAFGEILRDRLPEGEIASRRMEERDAIDHAIAVNEIQQN